MTTRTLAIPTTAKGVGILEVTIGNVGTDFALGMVMNNVAVVDSNLPNEPVEVDEPLMFPP